MADALEARVISALAGIQNPRLENDLISSGMVRELDIGADGRVSFTFLLGSDDPATLVRAARSAVRAVDGVSEVKINVTNPTAPARSTHGPPQSAGMPAPPTPMEQPNLGRILAVSSGKGGVGKSTVAANLAVALAEAGFRVGVMDADIYGPNLPRMFGIFERPPVRDGQMQPLEAHGVRLMSLGFIVERDAAAIWRGPIIMKIIQQFLRDVNWGELDYFIVDMPPGTGDAQLSLVQSVHVSAALIVTTPQEMAVGDALRGARMFERVGVPVIGIVENMGPFTDPTGRRWELFSSGGGLRLAEELGVPLLASVPLEPGLAELADAGQPVLVGAPDSAAAKALRTAADRVREELGTRPVALPILRG